MDERPPWESMWSRAWIGTGRFIRRHPSADAVLVAVGEGLAVGIVLVALPPQGLSENPWINALWVTGTFLGGLLMASGGVFLVMTLAAPFSQRREARRERDATLSELTDIKRPRLSVERDESVPYSLNMNDHIRFHVGEILRLKVTNTGDGAATFSASGVWIDQRTGAEQCTTWDACWIEESELKIERRIYPQRTGWLHLGLVKVGRTTQTLYLAPSRPGGIENRDFHSEYRVSPNDRLLVTVSRDDSQASESVRLHVFTDKDGNPEYEVD